MTSSAELMMPSSDAIDMTEHDRIMFETHQRCYRMQFRAWAQETERVGGLEAIDILMDMVRVLHRSTNCDDLVHRMDEMQERFAKAEPEIYSRCLLGGEW